MGTGLLAVLSQPPNRPSKRLAEANTAKVLNNPVTKRATPWIKAEPRLPRSGSDKVLKMRLSLLRSVIRRDPTSKHWEAWTGKHANDARSDDLWTKITMPSLLFPTLYRKWFPHTRGKYSEQTAGGINLGISVFYVLFAGSSAVWFYGKWRENKNETKMHDETEEEYYLRTNARSQYKFDSNHKFKSVKLSLSGITTEDVTENVQSNIDKSIGSENLDDPNYDKYRDDKYVRARLGLKPDDEEIDIDYCGALLRRKDKRSIGGPFARSPLGVGH